MKKLYLIIAVILCLGIFTSCNATNSDSASTTGSPNESLEPLQPLSPTVVQPILFDSLDDAIDFIKNNDLSKYREHDVVNGYVCCMEIFEPNFASDFYNKIKNGTVEPFCTSCKNQLSGLIYDCWHPEHLNQ